MSKRKEHNLIVGSGKSEAEVTSNERRRGIVLLKLTAEVSRGLSATAELLVFC